MKFTYGITYERYGIIREKLFESDSSETHIQKEIRDGEISLNLNIALEPQNRKYTLSVKNSGAVTVFIKTAKIFETKQDNLVDKNEADEIRFYTDWDHIWHCVGMTNSDDNIWNLKRYHSIYNAGILRKRDALGVAVTFETPNNYGSAIEFEDNKLSAFEYVDKELKVGETLTFDTFKISEYTHFSKALTSLHEEKKSRKDIADIRKYFGYNTWESYSSNIKPEDIYENLEAIKRTPLLKEHIKYFIIDDGWQSGSGYWEANEKFPMGMKEIADKIKEAGLIPGIWSAPFIVTDNDGNTELIKDHPDWFLRDRDGNMVPTSPRNPTYILDITHPEVKTYVSNIYKKFNDWGYRYYKTDFLKEATLPMIHGNMEFIDGLQRYDRTVTPEEAMNEINKIIRDAIGENSFWMGCGTQLTTNCDLMDASRVGGDISPRWARVPWQVAAVAWRLPLNGHRFLADPDFTVMTSNCTVEPEGIPEGFRNPKPYTFNGFNGPIFSENEVKAWLSFIIISGGLVNLSDRLAYLKPYALELLEKVYKYAGGPGFLAIDAENTLPGIYTRPYKDKTLLAVFNWFDEDKDMTIPFGTSILPSPKKLKEIWSGEISDVTGDPITLRVPARSAFLYEF